ncbi:MAG: hypothetical protein QOE37_1551 [Microbacteriaceae bacterium]|nr:hypothetical protein [Microbacteriaceae bacterium]
MVEWHPRNLVLPVEWLLTVPGHAEPVAVIRRLKLAGRVVFRAVTWAPGSGGRELIGYYPDGDSAAVAVWRHHLEQDRVRHERASRTHGGRERG